MIMNTIHWLQIDFSSLHDPRYDYKKQTRICPHRVEMVSAAMVHFGMDPGKLMHWLGGEYIGDRRDVARILATVHGHISEADNVHMKRILDGGCPVELKFNEPLWNELTMIK